jgi:hypothetical protein
MTNIDPIVVTLSRQLGWSHFVEIVPLKDESQFAPSGEELNWSQTATTLMIIMRCQDVG